ncbi:MAG: YkgJ family cysteine cluster protein [Gemmataceae bacterium]|nr:YkgJ family cysteine cluster protein [Gemmataceae bacterium]
MSRVIRSLPVMQNWDCGGGCTECCRQYAVYVTEDERNRILAQGWDKEPDLQGVELFERVGHREGNWRLRHRPDGGCVFLDADNRCRIHARFGLEAKPFACRLYPFILIPWGDRWSLGLRFSCPSATRNDGRPLSDYADETRALARILEQRSNAAAIPPPPLPAEQSLDWTDFERIVTALDQLLAQPAIPLEQRWRQILFVVDLLRTARFDGGGDPRKAVVGRRLSQLLEILSQAARDEVPVAMNVPPPSRKARVLFRSLLAVYVRKDTGPQQGSAQRTVWGRLWAAWRFARGRGRVPRLHGAIPADARFAAAESAWPQWNASATALLQRWSRVKIASGQFCGPGNFGLDVWEGIESLAVAFTAALWLGRLLNGHGQTLTEALIQAIRIVDDNFGFNPLLHRWRQRQVLRLLRRGSELARLITWYSRVACISDD